jgi:hypothetical protein
MSRHPFILVLAILLAMVAMPRRLFAQSGPKPERFEVSFAIGASLGDGGTALASTLELDVPVSSRFAVGVEAAHARSLDFALDLCPPPLVCIRGGRLPVTGRTVALIPHVKFEVLPRSRVRLSLQGGVGGGHVRQRWVDAAFTPGIEFTRSSLTAALSLGATTTVDVSNRVTVGVDIRSLQVFDEHSPDSRFIQPSGTLRTVRVAARTGWRF